MPTATVRSILPGAWNVPQRFRERLGDRAGRQRTMAHEGHLLLVLHAPPGPDETERRGRFFWRQPDGTWSATELGSGPHALVAHLNEFGTRLELLEQDEAEADGAEDYFRVLEALAPLHRTVHHLHQVLQQARELAPDDRDLINSRDRAYELERTADLLHADVKNALDYALARRAEEQARSSHRMAVAAHRLNVLAALFFPIATLCAVFGVNLRHGFEATAWDPWPFFGVLALGLLCGTALALLITRTPR